MKGTVFALTLLIVGCTPQYADFFPYHDDGAPKPTVVLLPMRCIAEGAQYSVADDLTKYIRRDLMQSGRVFIPHKQLDVGDSLFYQNDKAAFAQFTPGECVVITELIIYKKTPYRKLHKNSREVPTKDAVTLSIGIRLKIVKVEQEEIQTLREELIQKDMTVVADAFEEGSKFFEEVIKAHKKVAEDLAITIEKASRIKAVA